MFEHPDHLAGVAGPSGPRGISVYYDCGNSPDTTFSQYGRYIPRGWTKPSENDTVHLLSAYKLGDGYSGGFAVSWEKIMEMDNGEKLDLLNVLGGLAWEVRRAWMAGVSREEAC